MVKVHLCKVHKELKGQYDYIDEKKLCFQEMTPVMNSLVTNLGDREKKSDYIMNQVGDRKCQYIYSTSAIYSRNLRT
jgi:hypothetical protein